MTNRKNQLLLRLGKAQIDAMFARQQKGPAIDDSDFIPLLQTVLTAFETAGFEMELVGELWEHAYTRYDQGLQGSRANLDHGGEQAAHATVPSAETAPLAP
jgi:hypothetical protein